MKNSQTVPKQRTFFPGDSGGQRKNKIVHFSLATRGEWDSLCVILAGCSIHFTVSENGISGLKGSNSSPSTY